MIGQLILFKFRLVNTLKVFKEKPDNSQLEDEWEIFNRRHEIFLVKKGIILRKFLLDMANSILKLF